MAEKPAKKARKGKKAEITGIPRNAEDRLIVQKSTPLYGLWKSDLSLADFKILDTYLSRINSHDLDHRTVHFEKGEIEQLLGVKKINAQDLKVRVKHLCTAVPVDDPEGSKAFRMISLFEEAVCEPDELGVWQVDLTCTNAARKYIFNIENLGYFRYKLRTVTRLRSRYSYILFMYLERNRHMHSVWEIDLDELRLLLRCDQEETYQQYKRFNDRLLKRCHKELTENTECQFSYEPVRKGRRVVAVRFFLGTIAGQLEGQMSFADISEIREQSSDKADRYSSEKLAFLAEACNFEFSDAEMRVLLDLILKVYPYDGQNGLEHFNYLHQKYNLLQLYSQKKKITNRFNYLKAIIERDGEEPV